MTILLLGLALFLGVHSTRIVADGWRTRTLARIGEPRWKGLYSVLSIAGFALVLWGYARARQDPVVLWPSPLWARHLALPLTWGAFVLVTAAYVPGNGIKARLHHPMVLGVKVWALAHLLANNTLADLLLFGGFLVWAVFAYRAARQRDRAAGTVYAPGRASRTLLAVALGSLAWALFAFWLHGAWLGVRPLG